MGGPVLIYLENCYRRDTCSVVVPEPKLGTEVHEFAGEARFQLNRRTFYQLELSKNGLLMFVAGRPSLEVLSQSYFLAGEGEAGDFC